MENPKALEAVLTGVEQTRTGPFVKPRDLAAALAEFKDGDEADQL